MPRPKKPRRLNSKPNVYYFKPRGIPLYKLEEIVLEKDEFEALKLHDVDGFDQKKSAESMEISQSTFARIIDKTHKKLANGIFFGKAIRVEK